MSHQLQNPNNALYMQANESYSILKMQNGNCLLKTRPMKFFSEKLTQLGWRKIHKSFMVNPLYVQSITNDRNGIQLQNGQVLPISRRNKKEVFKWRNFNMSV
jgi:two-component system, LytTR family, response regulator